MFWEFPLRIQAIDTATDALYYKEFQTKEEFTEFVWSCFKIPGQYNLKNTKSWQKEGLKYAASVTKPNFEGGFYTKAVKGSHQYKVYWNNEKDKVLKGIIIDGQYIPPFYYWYLNFCPIYNDIKKKKQLGYVWDSDLWFFQYVMLCLLLGKHVCVVKARQRGYSFKIMALLYWCYCWFEGSVNTIGAYKDDYVSKSWRFLEFYRKHINTYTAWKRGPVRPKAQEWFERTETSDGNYVGLDSKLSGTTFKADPENGVGGSQTFFFYEESGIAPTLLKTVGYVRPALEKGNTTSGCIIVSGAVGELEDAEDIQEIFYNPDVHNFLGVKNIWDEDPENEYCGLFVSEAYNLEGFTDADGNSLVDEALVFIKEAKEKAKNKKKAELSQLDASQKPTSPREAFAQRNLSFWPIDKIARQQEIIKIKKERGELKHKQGILEISESTGKTILRPLSSIKFNPPTEMGYPVKPDWKDKRGVVTIFEEPPANPEPFVFFAGIDTVEVGDTTTSDSLFSIYIVKRFIEVHYTDKDGNKRIRYEGGNIVACYTGRYSEVEDHNTQGELLLKMYNAVGAAERNKPNFINMMKRKGLAARYLLEKNQLQLYKDVDVSGTERGEYGVYFGADGKAEEIMNKNVREHILQPLDIKRKKNEDGTDGEIVKIITQLDFIEDYWLLEEMRLNKPGKNADRLRAYGLAVTAARSFENTYTKKVYEKPEEQYEEFKKKVRARSLLASSSQPRTNRNNNKRRSLI